jgi:hypothetical protein
VKWSSDALSRCENVKADVVEIPVEDDPYFQYVPDKVGQHFSDLIASIFIDGQAVHLNDTHAIMNDIVYIDHMKIADVPASPS